jgi:hypothetical protein
MSIVARRQTLRTGRWDRNVFHVQMMAQKADKTKANDACKSVNNAIGKVHVILFYV